MSKKKSTALTWIVAEAKKLKREFPNRFKKWTDYVAQASAIYSKKHGGKSPVGHKRKKTVGMPKTHKRSTARKAIRAARRAHAAEGRALRKLGTVKSYVGKAKDKIKKDIAVQEIRKLSTTKKRMRKKIQKKINEKKAILRKLGSI
jgi:hypothetical protein